MPAVSNRPGIAGTLLVIGAVTVQLLLEVTLGRVFRAPNVLALVLTYLSINYGNVWSIDSAFWAGVTLDLLLHQPLGASSLGLLAGLQASRLLIAAAPGGNRMTIVLSGAFAGLVYDVVFLLAASRPFLHGLGSHVLPVAARLLMTLVAGILFISVATALSSLRVRGRNEAV